VSAKHRKHDYQTARTLAQPGVLVFSHENLWDLVNLVKLSTTPEKVGPVTSLDDLLHRMGRQATEQLRRHVADELGRWAKRDVYWYVDKLSKHMFKMDFAKAYFMTAAYSKERPHAKKPHHHRVCGEWVHDHRGNLRRKR